MRLHEVLCEILRDDAPCGSADLKLQIAAFDPPQLVKALHERIDITLPFRVILGSCGKIADPSEALGLLRARTKGP